MEIDISVEINDKEKKIFLIKVDLLTISRAYLKAVLLLNAKLYRRIKGIIIVSTNCGKKLVKMKHTGSIDKNNIQTYSMLTRDRNSLVTRIDTYKCKIIMVTCRCECKCIAFID